MKLKEPFTTHGLIKPLPAITLILALTLIVSAWVHPCLEDLSSATYDHIYPRITKPAAFVRLGSFLGPQETGSPVFIRFVSHLNPGLDPDLILLFDLIF